MLRLTSVICFCVGLLCLAQAQVPLTGAGKAKPSGGIGAESYAFIGGQNTEIGSDTAVFTISVPAGYVVIGVGTGATTIVSVTVGSTALSLDELNAGGAYAIYSGTVATSSTTVTVVTTGGSFTDRDIIVYVINGINSTGARQTTQYQNTNGSISVTAGYFLFAFATFGGSSSFSGSTPAPTNKCAASCTVAGANGTSETAGDWIIASSGSVSLVTANFSNNVAAAYH